MIGPKADLIEKIKASAAPDDAKIFLIARINALNCAALKLTSQGFSHDDRLIAHETREARQGRAAAAHRTRRVALHSLQLQHHRPHHGPGQQLLAAQVRHQAGVAVDRLLSNKRIVCLDLLVSTCS
jgi:hypothetical protein